MDPALQADLGGPATPRLLAATDDLVERNEVGGPAQVLGELALRERAEAAAEVADVRVLDVPRHDVADLVAADLAAHPVGRGEDALTLLSASAEEPDDLLLAQLVARVDGQRVARDDERRRTGLAGRPAVLASEAERVRPPECRRQHTRRDPLRVEVARIHGEPRRQLEPTRAGRLPQPLDL